MKTASRFSERMVWGVLVCLGLSVTIASGQITAVSPHSGPQGATDYEVTFTLDPNSFPPVPPTNAPVNSAMIGTISGAALPRTTQYSVTAVFDIPADEAVGSKNAVVTFLTPQGSTLTYSMVGGFDVVSGADAPPTITQQPQSETVPAGSSVALTVVAWGAEALEYEWYKDDVLISGATDASLEIAAATQSDVGNYYCIVSNTFGTVTSEIASLSLTTGPPYDGYNLFAPMQSTETYLMDNDGTILKTWTSDYSVGLSAYLLEDGTLLRSANVRSSSFSEGGVAGRVEQFDWDGNLIWGYDHSSSSYCGHHDVEMLPNGNVLMIAWERKTEAEALAAGRDSSLLTDDELWPDYIIEVQPNGASGGTIVWEWHVWDHLIQDYDATKPNYGVVADHPELIDLNYTSNGKADWNHLNSIDYNEALDQIVVSSRNFSEIWIIDHGTTTAEAAGAAGDLLYRWGNPQTYGAGDASDQQLFVQHDAEWIESDCPGAGDILIFNNGQGRSDGNYSSVDQITPPMNPDGTYAPAAPNWSYASTPTSDFYAMRISGSQRLPNGNTLICEGTEGRFFEVDTDGVILWEYIYSSSEVFRVERYGVDYAGFVGTELEPEELPVMMYPIVDTGQVLCYNNTSVIAAPADGQAHCGQDAQIDGHQPSYTLTDGGLTVTDDVTGLVWTQTADINNDGTVDAADKLSYDAAVAYAGTLNDQEYAGCTDWRLPSIKELYSLMDFRGLDPSGDEDTSNLVPFVDTDYFGFGYGDTASGERLIDAQWASSTLYVSTTMGGNDTMFGLNLADGRIKGYPMVNKTYYVYYVRGNTDYGVNNFVDNLDGTISDRATGLMWSQDDSGEGGDPGPRSGMDWEEALAWVQTKNAEEYLGYADWRLPDAKELQSIVDYGRSPDTTGSAAIGPVFNTTQITNEAGQVDYPWFWSGTTHANSNGGGQAGAYVCFGRGMGYWSSIWQDVHGAGCQRSDLKSGDLSSNPQYTYVADGYYLGNAPQGDATRVNNYVRLVRDIRCGEPGYVSALPGDLDADCYVDMHDVAEAAREWQAGYEMADLAEMAQYWLECIDPDAPCNYQP